MDTAWLIMAVIFLLIWIGVLSWYKVPKGSVYGTGAMTRLLGSFYITVGLILAASIPVGILIVLLSPLF